MLVGSLRVIRQALSERAQYLIANAHALGLQVSGLLRQEISDSIGASVANILREQCQLLIAQITIAIDPNPARAVA